MKIGEYKGLVASIALSISEERPAIFTRIKLVDQPAPNDHATHVVRLSNPDSQRIGFDELRSAFPKQLASLNDEELLTHLIEKTGTLEGAEVTVGIEAQLKNGVAQKDNNGRPYYNVRLRSAVRNLDHESAASLARKMLSASVSKKIVDDAFADTAQ
jgi:hypothetical protein